MNFLTKTKVNTTSPADYHHPITCKLTLPCIYAPCVPLFFKTWKMFLFWIKILSTPLSLLISIDLHCIFSQTEKYLMLFFLLTDTEVSVLECHVIQFKEVTFRGKRENSAFCGQIQCVCACMGCWCEVPFFLVVVNLLCFVWHLVTL